MGCGSGNPKVNKPKDDPKKEEPAENQRLNSGSGDMTMRDLETKEPLWFITWKTIQIMMEGDMAMNGSMKEVKGQFYEKNKEASDFEAAGADADKQKNVLKLWGKVIVRSKEYHATLTCDKLTWHAKRGVLEATGKVTIVSDDYTLGPFDRLLCSPKLMKISTPDLFKEPK